MENRIKSFIKKLKRFGYNIKTKERNHYDPVCGMKATADFFLAQYQGKSYYFCSEYCKRQFEINPNEYLG